MFEKIRIKFPNLVYLSAGIAALFSASTVAQSHYSLAELEAAAVNFVNSQLPDTTDAKREVSALPLDSRLPTRSCESGLIFNTAPSQSFNRQVPVQIKCDDEKNHWFQYVQVKIELTYPVLVATRMIAKGDAITQNDLAVKYKARHFVRQTSVTDTEHVIGARAKRGIRPGQAINTQLLCVVCKDDKVTIYAKHQSLRVKATGIAQQDGSLGEQIRVKNSRSGKDLHAKVASVGVVEVTF